MAAASCGELGATEPVRCGLASHSFKNKVESVNAAMIFLAMMPLAAQSGFCGGRIIQEPDGRKL
jgi:hypothetical protein